MRGMAVGCGIGGFDSRNGDGGRFDDERKW